MSACTYDPRLLAGQPIGMFHCPECGEMVVAGMPHPEPITDEEYAAGLKAAFLRDLRARGRWKRTIAGPAVRLGPVWPGYEPWSPEGGGTPL